MIYGSRGAFEFCRLIRGWAFEFWKARRMRGLRYGDTYSPFLVCFNYFWITFLGSRIMILLKPVEFVTCIWFALIESSKLDSGMLDSGGFDSSG